jgi:hypothetical protein
MSEQLADMEADLSRTGELLKTHANMEWLWKRATAMLAEAQEAFKCAEMNQ